VVFDAERICTEEVLLDEFLDASADGVSTPLQDRFAQPTVPSSVTRRRNSHRGGTANSS
jgi:hypothetical protein